MDPSSRSSWFSKPPTDITLEDAKKYLSPSLEKSFENTESMSSFGKVWTHIKAVASAKWERIKHKRKTGGLLKGEWYDNAAVCSLIADKIKNLNQKISNNPTELTDIQKGALEMSQICELLKASGAKQVNSIENSIKGLFATINSKSNETFPNSSNSHLKQDVDKLLNKCQSALMDFENKSHDERNIALKKARKYLKQALDPLIEIRKKKFKQAYKEANQKYDEQEIAINKAQAEFDKAQAELKKKHSFSEEVLAVIPKMPVDQIALLKISDEIRTLEGLEKLEEIAIEPVIQPSEKPHASILLSLEKPKNTESKKFKKKKRETTAELPLPLIPFSNTDIEATQIIPVIQGQNSQTCFTDLEIQQARGAWIKELQGLNNLILANTTFLEKSQETFSFSNFIYDKLGHKEVGYELTQAAKNVPMNDHGAVLAKDIQPIIQALKKMLNILKKRENFQEKECYQKLLKIRENMETVENNRKFSVQTHAKRVRSPIEVCKNQLSVIKNKHPAESMKVIKNAKSALKDTEEQIKQYKAAGYEADLVSKGYEKEIETLKNSIKLKKEEIRQKAALDVLNITDHLDSLLGFMTSEKIVKEIRNKIKKEASDSQKILDELNKMAKAVFNDGPRKKTKVSDFLTNLMNYPSLRSLSSTMKKETMDFFISTINFIVNNPPSAQETTLAETFNASKNEKALAEVRANLKEAKNLLQIAKKGDIYELAKKRLTDIEKRLQ